MASLLSNTFTTLRQIPKFTIQTSCQLHQIASRLTAIPVHPPKAIAPSAPVIPCGALSPSALIGCGWFTQSVRHKKKQWRDKYPKPRENKRFQFTWWARMKTRGGRMILMRKLIKGRHQLGYPI